MFPAVIPMAANGMLFRRNKGSVGCATKTSAKIIKEGSPGWRGKGDWSLRSNQQLHGPCGCMASMSIAVLSWFMQVHGRSVSCSLMPRGAGACLYVHCTFMAPGGTWPLCLLQPHGCSAYYMGKTAAWR